MTRRFPRPQGSHTVRITSAAAIGLAALTVSACTSPASDVQLPAPVIITEEQVSASCSVGETVVIVIPEGEITETVVESSDLALIEITQAHRDETASFNAGGQCLAPGIATLTVRSPDGSLREITLTISE